jgi:hypothetical protein
MQLDDSASADHLVLPIPPMFSLSRAILTGSVARTRQADKAHSRPESLTCGSTRLNCARARGGVAQLVRASACHAEGRGFESRRSRQRYQALSRCLAIRFRPPVGPVDKPGSRRADVPRQLRTGPPCASLCTALRVATFDFPARIRRDLGQNRRGPGMRGTALRGARLGQGRRRRSR